MHLHLHWLYGKASVGEKYFADFGGCGYVGLGKIEFGVDDGGKEHR